MDSIPTCEDQEDHIAMSSVAARRAARVVQNSQRVIAIELLTAAHALEYRMAQNRNEVLGKGTAIALRNIEAFLFDLPNDSSIGDQIEAIVKGIESGKILSDISFAKGVRA